MKLTLPIDSAERKGVPIMSGCIEYFPAALAGVAAHSKTGNDKHNPGQELHHSRGKSSDHADCIVRHLIDLADMRAYIDRCDAPVPVDQILTEVNALCWRALALSQQLHEQFNGVPLAPRAREGVAAQPPVDNGHVAPGCEQFASAMPDGMSATHFCASQSPAIQPGYSAECSVCRKAIGGTG